MAAEPEVYVDLSHDLERDPVSGVEYGALARMGGDGLVMLAQGAVQEALNCLKMHVGLVQHCHKTYLSVLAFIDGVSGFKIVNISYAYLYNYTKMSIADPNKHVQILE